MKPLLSICIPTYNRSAYLVKCIRSVLAYPGNDIEIIISDNASADDTPVVVNQFKDSRITYKRNTENIGPVNNFYQLLKMAKGEFIFILTDDDFLLPDSIDILISFISNNDVDSFTCDLIVYNEKSKATHNYSYLDKTVILSPSDYENQAKIWRSAHILTGCCFKRNKIPQSFLDEERFLWYPSMYLMGILSSKQGYIAQPLAIHTWENELFWNIDDDKKAEQLAESIIETLHLILEQNKNEEQIKMFAKNLIAEELRRNQNKVEKIPPGLRQFVSNKEMEIIKSKNRKSFKVLIRIYLKKILTAVKNIF